jgi:hypothetical protein
VRFRACWLGAFFGRPGAPKHNKNVFFQIKAKCRQFGAQAQTAFRARVFGDFWMICVTFLGFRSIVKIEVWLGGVNLVLI